SQIRPSENRSMRKLVLLALSLVVVAGCGQPTLDCSSRGAVDASLQRIRDSATAKERDQISDSIMLVLISNSLESKKRLAPHEAAKRFDGMTGKEIIEAMKDDLREIESTPTK